MVIYKTINTFTGEYYIGKDANNNPAYLGSGLILKRAIKKYGHECFEKIILEVCETKEQLNTAEQKWVTLEVVQDPLSYNIAFGGHGGNLFTHEQKIENGICKKISDAHKGKALSEEHKENIKKGQEAYRSNRVVVHKEPNKAHYGENNHFFGKKHTGDMSRFGKHRKGVPPTNAKPVICLDTGIVYSSSHEASLEYENPNTARRAISAVCRGIRKDYMNKKYVYL